MDEMISVLKLLADRTRLTILLLIRDKQRCVCELVEVLQTTQPNISQHMRKLKEAGLVHEDRRGRWAYYSLAVEDRPYVRALLSEISLPEETDGCIGENHSLAGDICCE